MDRVRKANGILGASRRMAPAWQQEVMMVPIELILAAKLNEIVLFSSTPSSR